MTRLLLAWLDPRLWLALVLPAPPHVSGYRPETLRPRPRPHDAHV